jgi:hypothetical protein
MQEDAPTAKSPSLEKANKNWLTLGIHYDVKMG